jgi:hypothetical protein
MLEHERALPFASARVAAGCRLATVIVWNLLGLTGTDNQEEQQR